MDFQNMRLNHWMFSLLTLAFPVAAFAGLDEGISAYDRKDYKTALKEFQGCSEKPVCQTKLALMYFEGEGVKSDYATSLQWYTKAALQGHADAQYNTGMMHLLGEGAAVNELEAEKWLLQSAEQGHPAAQFNLGSLYLTGKQITLNNAEAVKWLRKAAEQDVLGALHNMAVLTISGTGVEKSEVEAAKFFKRAAEFGFANSQHNLATMYFSGQGLEKDDALGSEWLKKSAEQGHAPSQHNMGVRLRTGNGMQINEIEALSWYQKAADQGFAQAQNDLGYMYGTALGGLKLDIARALYWYARSAQQGLDIAAQNIAGILPRSMKMQVRSGGSVLRENPKQNSPVIAKLKAGDVVYNLNRKQDYVEVYLPDGHLIGYLDSKAVTEVKAVPEVKPEKVVNKPAKLTSNFPPRPASQPGKTVCSTKCFNAQCFRTYSDGREVKFTAKQIWDPFNSTWKFDSGSC